MRRFLLHYLLCLIGCTTLAAQSVQWRLPEGGFEIGQSNQLVLIFENCTPTEDPPPLPAVANLDFGTPQRQTSNYSQTSIINGKTQVTNTAILYYAFPARPLDHNRVEIPAFSVATDQGDLTVPAASARVRDAVFANTNIPMAQITGSSVQVGDGEVWAGEVIDVDYTIWHLVQLNGQFGEPTWEPAPFVAEPWPQAPTAPNGQVDGDKKSYQFTTRGLLNTPGQYTLPSVQQATLLSVPSRSMFDRPPSEQVVLSSNAPQLTVKPLPQPAPADFTGAVGTFTLVSKAVPESAAVGDPITWTFTLAGTGNWPAISSVPAREVSNAFRVVQPQAERNIPEDKLFEGNISEDVVLIPTQPGTFQLPSVTWTYFDPGAGKYRTLTTEEHEITVTPSASPAPGAMTAPPQLNGGAAPPALDGPQPLDASAPTRLAATPGSPAALPLDPLAAQPAAPSPISLRAIIITGIVTAALLPCFWLALAFRHARAADPGRFARAAQRQLPAAIHRISSAPNEISRVEALLNWQRTVATLWQSPSAVPTARIFAGDETWSQLWRDAERALYADEATLPTDWVERARAAATARRAPRFPLLRTFALRHLFPAFALLAAASALLSPSSARAAETAPPIDPLAAYNEGDFATAEQQWRADLADAPTTWTAHHNLALALAQQGKWGEAGAHAAAAFVQHPEDASVRWHLNYTLERSGYSPPVFRRFMTPGWEEKIARVCSPAGWQRALLGTIALAGLALALLIAAAYRRRAGYVRPLAWLCLLLALSGAIGATLSLQTYGLTAQPDAVLTWQTTTLRSIPSDLAEEQQTTSLAPGSLARVTKSFLGWRQLAFPNGQTGWVRQEELVGLWQQP